ncbi:hypothetical protein PIB30_055006 [Stylosanthes scabra]|uniref:Uncharacterized protein n=1 Tax=Stylosanthes scabra TaxID=79078 RepID=A0ABU6YK52_9FABA|nr:hypothetical protein [Stylosanthes scabra]
MRHTCRGKLPSFVHTTLSRMSNQCEQELVAMMRVKGDQMMVNGMKFQTQSNSSGRTTDNTGVYLKGECGWYGILNEILELEYLGNRKIGQFSLGVNVSWKWQIKLEGHFKCKPCGRIESQEVVIQDEAYQSTEEIPVRVITKTEIPETLRSSALEVDIIVNAQLPNTENEDESEEDEGNNEDNGSASADSLSTQDDE